MKIKCFFCNTDLQMQADTSGGSYRVRHSESCEVCAKQGNLHEVISTYHEDGSFNYVHIHTDKQEYVTYGPHFVGRCIIPPSYFRSNTSYHIRYNVDKDTTDIMVLGNTDPILSFSGLKIKPVNAREKLKLYLLFS